MKRLVLLLGWAAAACAGVANEPASSGGGATAVAAPAPSVAELRAYAESGAYDRDVAAAAAPALTWLEMRVRLEPRHGGDERRLAVVFDLDETLLRNLPTMLEHEFRYVPDAWAAWVEAAKAPALDPVREVYREARRLGLAVVFLTARRERERDASLRNLRAIDCGEFAELLCRPDDSPLPSSAYKLEQRRRLAAAGYVIIANVGDQRSDFAGGGAERDFRIPNPFYTTP